MDPNHSIYTLLMLAGIVLGAVWWTRLSRRDGRLLFVYVGGLCGAFIGGKIVYFAAEGRLLIGTPDPWPHWLAGKTVLGALLGGYLGVELGKRQVGYRRPTGDRFALIAPGGIILGRVGCLMHGCCLGVTCEPSWFTIKDLNGIERWPAVPAEILFNASALVIILYLRFRNFLPNQHFHLYLMGYGLFRFGHEWLRNTPTIAIGLSGYQFAAITVLLLGVVRYRQRARENLPPDEIGTA